MKISNNWLKDFINTDLDTPTISRYLTDIGLEVEGTEPFESLRGSLQGVLVGKVLTCDKHPNADKLKKTTVDVGGEILEIVCGAPNVEAGQTVPVATVGTKIYAKDGSHFEIKEAKIRGEKSQGMICAEDELGLGDDHGGIMVLDENRFKVGTDFASYFDIVQDDVYEIGLTPNRTDAMSHYGVARDLHAFLTAGGMASQFSKLEEKPVQPSGDSGFTLVVEDAELCPRYIGAVIENVQVKDSPAWLQNRLRAIGLSPINNIVDITNYILHGLGQPLHAFDADKIEGRTVRVGTVAAGTSFTTLDSAERKLNGGEIMIKDGQNSPLCIAGVFGGMESGVSDTTKTIFLESAYFNPVAVRKGAKSHGLNTDASFRFERGVDPEMTRIAILHAIKMIEELAGGTLRGELLEFYPERILPHRVSLRIDKVNQILGTEIPEVQIKVILKALEIEIMEEKEGTLQLSVPAYRADVTREIDVIEELLRIYGYNKVEAPEKIAFTPVKLSPYDIDELENSWARALQSQGFNEVMNNSLTANKSEEDTVKLLNPLSNDLSVMRTSLLDGLLQNAIYNINRRTADLKLFEFGKIYHKRKTYEERRQLAVMVTGRNHAENWLLPKSATDFYVLKGYTVSLLQKTGLAIDENALEDNRFGDALELMINGKTVARLGVVSQEMLKMYDIDQPVYYAEIEIETVQSLRSRDNLKFAEIPKFNRNRRDLALLVDRTVMYSDLYRSIQKNAAATVKKVNLFDVYEGKNLPEGKKSYAISFELLNEEKTMEDKEINAVMERLVKAFQKDFNAELR